VEIERAISRRLGLSVRCLARTRDDLQRVVDGNPLAQVASDAVATTRNWNTVSRLLELMS
jgi:uncharacterized protein (DUF1697 family)